MAEVSIYTLHEFLKKSLTLDEYARLAILMAETIARMQERAQRTEADQNGK